MFDARKILAILPAVALLLACAGTAGAAGTVGEAAPDFKLQDLNGDTVALSDLAGKTVVLEWINPNCPFSDRHAREKTMTDLAAAHGEVVWLAINSTNPEHRDFLTREEHKAYNEKRGISYAVLYDESGEVGHAYGAKTTPHMYIIDGGGTLVYNGAIDDDPRGGKERAERANYVAAGLTAMAGAEAVDPASTKPYGCSVKY